MYMAKSPTGRVRLGTRSTQASRNPAARATTRKGTIAAVLLVLPQSQLHFSDVRPADNQCPDPRGMRAICQSWSS